MIDQGSEKGFTAYFDDSEGVSDEGHLQTVVAAVLIRNDVLTQVETQAEKVWEKYLPSVRRTEFHAKEMEEAVQWPFSTLADGEPLAMQKDFINIISSSNLRVVAVTIDANAFASNRELGESLEALSPRVLAMSFAIGVSYGSLINVSAGERLSLIPDKGLISTERRRQMEAAITLLRSDGANEFSNITQRQGLPFSPANQSFQVDSAVSQVASEESTGVQLADHVARYVFKYAKNPNPPDPRYSVMEAAGVRNYSQSHIALLHQVQGVTLHIRFRDGATFTPGRQDEEQDRLGRLETSASQYRVILRERFNRQFKCPKCTAILFWGDPTSETLDASRRGELRIVSGKIQKRNYCPICKALVFTA